jgi:hypothetical protein
MEYGYEYDPVGVLGSGLGLLIYFAILIIMVAAYWKVFTKAGKAGWLSIIPIINLAIMLEIVKRPVWWLVLYLVPFVNIVVHVIVTLDTARAFGKGSGFGLGLFFLPVVFYPVLGFGSARYEFAPAPAPAPVVPAPAAPPAHL